MRRLFLLLCALCLSGCSQFLNLRQELREAGTRLGRIAGVVISPGCAQCPTILVAMGDSQGREVHTYRIYEQPGRFEMVTFAESRYVFAFNDQNRDFRHQPGEPSALLALPDDFSDKRKIDDLGFVLKASAETIRQVPIELGSLADLRGETLGKIDVQLGVLTTLPAPEFDGPIAGMGMWQPFHFMKSGYAGIYFLEAYDPVKIPVLFVHGINGSPRDFTALIDRLDRRRYQPWLVYYPSGLSLEALGDSILGMVSELRHRYPAPRMHIVAHSMGGLVTQSYLQACIQNGQCGYVRSVVSLSTPFGGHQAARSGRDYAPVVVPVWRSLAPDSRFMARLFSRPLPSGVTHHLIFGYRNVALLSGESGDGTITLSSQLRAEAQQQAVSLRGFDEDHLSVLAATDVADYVFGRLNADVD